MLSSLVPLTLEVMLYILVLWIIQILIKNMLILHVWLLILFIMFFLITLSYWCSIGSLFIFIYLFFAQFFGNLHSSSNGDENFVESKALLDYSKLSEGADAVKPSSMALSEFHFLLLLGNKVKVCEPIYINVFPSHCLCQVSSSNKCFFLYASFLNWYFCRL